MLVSVNCNDLIMVSCVGGQFGGHFCKSIIHFDVFLDVMHCSTTFINFESDFLKNVFCIYSANFN